MIFFVGLLIGTALGLWLAVGALYLFRWRGDRLRDDVTGLLSLKPRGKPASASVAVPPASAGETLSTPPPFTLIIATEAEEAAYQRLLTIAKGNRNQVERLVGYEYRRRPYASTEELIQSAIDRWVRDNR